ncbi:MAG: NAD(P)-dependent oxidoreductase [Ornithinimicrobium sp.]
MSIVVTGASGFIGSTLLSALARAGHGVVSIDRIPLPHGVHSSTHLTAELTHPSDDILDALHDAEAVIHLAGCPGVRDDGPDVSWRRQRDNVDAARAVLQASAPQTPVIVASSSSVYGGASGGGSVRASREDDRPQARGGYAASKIAAERVCAQRAESGAHVLIARPFTVLGEGQRADMAVARWASQARATGSVTVLGSPQRTRDFTDVRNVAQVLITLVETGATGTVNVGTGVGHSLADLAAAVCSAVGVPPRLHVIPAARAEVEHTRADTERLRALIGSVPQTDLSDVVARAVASIEDRTAAGTAQEAPTTGVDRPTDAELVGV